MTTGSTFFGALRPCPRPCPLCRRPSLGRPPALFTFQRIFFFVFLFRLRVLRVALLLVALLRERRRRPRLQRRDVDRAVTRASCVVEREPVPLRAGVRRGEEPDELAALVEDGVGDVGEAVRQRERLLLDDGVDVERPDVRRAGERVGDPAGVGRPRPRSIFCGARRGARRRSSSPCRSRRRRPRAPGSCRSGRSSSRPGTRRGGVEARAGDLDPLRRPLAVLRAHDDLVLAALVGDVRDLLAVGRPGRRGSWTAAVFVRLRGSPFSAGTVTISPRNSSATRAPEGESDASRTHFAPFAQRGRVSRRSPRYGDRRGRSILLDASRGGGACRPARRRSSPRRQTRSGRGSRCGA